MLVVVREGVDEGCWLDVACEFGCLCFILKQKSWRWVLVKLDIQIMVWSYTDRGAWRGKAWNWAHT